MLGKQNKTRLNASERAIAGCDCRTFRTRSQSTLSSRTCNLAHTSSVDTRLYFIYASERDTQHEGLLQNATDPLLFFCLCLCVANKNPNFAGFFELAGNVDSWSV